VAQSLSREPDDGKLSATVGKLASRYMRHCVRIISKQKTPQIKEDSAQKLLGSYRDLVAQSIS
jgi:hypothetical protein